MALTSKQRYTQTDGALTGTYQQLTFLEYVGAFTVDNLGNGGTEKVPSTSGDTIVIRLGGEDDLQEYHIVPGSRKSFSGVHLNGMAIKRLEDTTATNFAIESIVYRV